MFTVIKSNEFSGVQYDAVNESIINHHTQNGEKIIWIGRILKRDSDGNIDETPTEFDLAAEVVTIEGFVGEKEKIKRLEEDQLLLWDLILFGGE